ncbi:MAG: hypothetical protein CME70_03460, partial [Halobacteriovorax sp.]|nr:hypothetical protein [Halobacteriovorax sp.]
MLAVFNCVLIYSLLGKSEFLGTYTSIINSLLTGSCITFFGLWIWKLSRINFSDYVDGGNPGPNELNELKRAFNTLGFRNSDAFQTLVQGVLFVIILSAVAEGVSGLADMSITIGMVKVFAIVQIAFIDFTNVYIGAQATKLFEGRSFTILRFIQITIKHIRSSYFFDSLIATVLYTTIFVLIKKEILPRYSEDIFILGLIVGAFFFARTYINHLTKGKKYVAYNELDLKRPGVLIHDLIDVGYRHKKVSYFFIWEFNKEFDV